MKKKIMGAAGAVAFAAILLTVGAVEQGAAVSWMWCTIPALMVLAMSAKVFSKVGSKQ